MSSGFAELSADGVEASGHAFVCGVWPPATDVSERAAASSEAEDSGTGDCVRAADAVSWIDGAGGAAGGVTGSLARGALTEVSPVNGFLNSVADVMTATAVGL